MNCLTVIQASQGLCKFLKSTCQNSGVLSVVIGRDARYNSEKFALLAARALQSEGIRVLRFDACTPTPLVPFAVLLSEASAGIMITASHVWPSFNQLLSLDNDADFWTESCSR